jgi:hypothetical protein
MILSVVSERTSLFPRSSTALEIRSRLAGGIILGLTYGYQVQERHDPFVNLIEHANGNFNAASIPGAFIVDFFPVLRSLPEFLPGMSFMETARQWRKDTQRMVDIPYNFTKEQMVRHPLNVELSLNHVLGRWDRASLIRLHSA